SYSFFPYYILHATCYIFSTIYLLHTACYILPHATYYIFLSFLTTQHSNDATSNGATQIVDNTIPSTYNTLVTRILPAKIFLETTPVFI
ncbi:hypothetical protein KKB40_04000, partial [Patescibacteria group bacterium]|nr:hypothetical protein [Patescibacteria group bacterium]